MSRAVVGPGEPIRPGATGRPPRGPRMWTVALAAIGVGVLLGLALALIAGDSDRTDKVASDRPPAPSTSPATSPPGTTEPTVVPTASPTRGESRDLGLYYLGEQADGEWWLYREFRSITVTDARPVRAAVNAMLTLPPLDPDYFSPWPASSRVLSTAKSGDTAIVDLTAAVNERDAPEAISRLAIQQLVHTATAADPTVRRVRILVEGEELTSLWGHPVGRQPIARAPQGDVLAPVWIIDPIEGATVGRTLTVKGAANVLEATVSYEVERAGSVTEDGTVTVTTGSGTRGDWSVVLTLDSGSYVLRFFSVSADTGERHAVDTKTIRVG